MSTEDGAEDEQERIGRLIQEAVARGLVPGVDHIPELEGVTFGGDARGLRHLQRLQQTAAFREGLRAARPARRIEQQFDLNVAIAVLRQRDLQVRLANHEWALDPQRGELRFLPKAAGGKPLTSQAQILGSVGRDGSWLWAWANQASGFAPEAVESAAQLRALGEELAIDELREPALRRVPLGDPHRLGHLAVGALDAAGYFVCAAPQGTVLVLLDASFWQLPELSATEVAREFAALLKSGLPISDRRLAFEGMIDSLRLIWVPEQCGEHVLLAEDVDGGALMADFSGPDVILKSRRARP